LSFSIDLQEISDKMPPRQQKQVFGDYLTVHWKKTEKFPHGSISVARRSHLIDGTLKYEDLLNKKVMINAEGTPMEAKVVFQGDIFLII